MQINLTPEFSNLFPGETAELEDLLAGIPSLLVIKLLAAINAELYSNDQGQPTQVKIFRLLMTLQAPEVSGKIIENAFLKNKNKENESSHFFSTSYNMNFLHHELLNFRDLPEIDLTPVQELNIFKAYFLIAQRNSDEHRQTSEKLDVDDPYYLEKLMWPSLFDQWELNNRINPFTMMLRGVVFLNYLQCHSKYSVYVANYLALHRKGTLMHYLLDIFALLKSNFDSIRGSADKWSSCSLGAADGFGTLYEQFNLTIKDYQTTYKENKQNFSGIKSRPLLLLDDKTWLVLNWSFLSSKMYEGLLFDFFQRSGIKELQEMSEFTKFKQFIGGEVTEGYLTRKLLQATFKVKHKVLLFDENGTSGFPDAYYRKGNQVILFEVKDAYFPASAINSYSYEKICAAINQKINTPFKGTGQLIKQIEKMTTGGFESRPGYKHVRNLEIFPVIICVDMFFNVPGVNHYVNNGFKEMLGEKKLEQHFKKIHPVTLININFFIQYFDLLECPGTQITTLIAYHYHQLAKHAKRFNRTHDMSDDLNSHGPFEQSVFDQMDVDKKGRKYVRACFDALDLTEGMPFDDTIS